MKILFLVPYPIGHSPSQRFRFEQYFLVLKEFNVEYRVQSFLTAKNWRVFYGTGNSLAKFAAVASGFTRRAGILLGALKYDFVFIHRETAPIGPPIFEWIVSRLLRRRIIYDFDDAIWLTDKKNESYVERTIRWRSKVSKICSWSYKVSVGNAYLAKYAKRFCFDVVVNPTTIDLDHVHTRAKKKRSNKRVVIGWTGSHSTLKYLMELEGVLKIIEAACPNVDFSIIADKEPHLKLERMQFKPWSVETEISDLADFDIGIMPMPNDEWTQGKCGFKALQYMALEIPTIAAPVGVNSDIIDSGRNGFLAEHLDQWRMLLENLVADDVLRQRIGAEGRKTVVERYSLSSNKANFMSLFKTRGQSGAHQN